MPPAVAAPPRFRRCLSSTPTTAAQGPLRTRATSDELLETIKNELNYNSRIRALYGDWGERTAKVWTKAVVDNLNSMGLIDFVLDLEEIEYTSIDE